MGFTTPSTRWGFTATTTTSAQRAASSQVAKAFMPRAFVRASSTS